VPRIIPACVIAGDVIVGDIETLPEADHYQRMAEDFSRIVRGGQAPFWDLDDAIALMTVCVGGMALSRAVADPKFSTRILRVAREAAAKLADTQPN